MGLLDLAHAAQLVASRTLEDLKIPSVVRRSAATCKAGDDSGICQKLTAAGNTDLTIGLAAGIPIVVAIFVLIFLHSRIRKKMNAEDAADKHKSLDFGNEIVGTRSRTLNKGPEMSVVDVENSIRPGMRHRGVSMDMDFGSPYVAAKIHGSRQSFNSLSKSLEDKDDPYRPVTLIKSKSDYESTRSETLSARSRLDNVSTLSASTNHSNENMNSNLLKNASRMSRSLPPPINTSAPAYNGYDIPSPYYDSSPQKHSLPYEPSGNPPLIAPPPHAAFPPRKEIDAGAVYQDNYMPQNRWDHQQDYPSEQEIPQHQYDENFRFELHQRGVDQETAAPLPPNHAQQHQSQDQRRYSFDEAAQMYEEPQQTNLGVQDFSNLTRKTSVMGTRPLPPDDPSDNPEQRANRIRSFYKEYFDDSKPNPPGQYPQYSEYEDEYVADLYEDGAVYDPETGAFYMPQAPYAQPIARRARTPPPQGAAPFVKGHRNTASTQSAARFRNQFGQPAGPPKKVLPPPAALKSLPTPHMLRDGAGGYSTIDFAPRTTFRDQQLGRGLDSPTGTSRPYMPAVHPHVPLARAFDDLGVIPSPHALLRDTTFSGLEFAPSPRFKREDGTGSDVGSIRSNHSGISAVQKQAVRAGAYRVSRIPKEMVGTTSDLATALKPTWDMRKA